MNRIISFLTGADHNLLWTSDPGSKKRYEAYAIAMLFPVAIWGYLGYKISGDQVWGALITSLVVWLFDRVILMNGSNGWLKGVRVVIALSMSLIGMVIIDEQIYHQDIEQELNRQRLEANRDGDSGLYLDLEKLNAEQKEWQSRLVKSDSAFRAEINFPGRPGFGKLAASLQKQSEYCQKKLDEIDQKIAALNSQIGVFEEEAFQPGLLQRIRILWQLILSDWLKVSIAILIMILVLGLETFPILLKWGCDKTAYDIRLYIESNNFRQLRKAV